MTEESGELLRIERASKTFGASGTSVAALGPIDLRVREGEFIAVVGPSGCGKSTLLRLAAGLELPTEGAVYYRGSRVGAPDRRRGVVFQTYNAFPWLTVRDNIAFGLRDEEDGANDAKVEKWLRFMELTEFGSAYPKTLSGGMRQRVALARTLIVEPELLLLDEPFGALDERTREAMRQLLQQAVAATGSSVVLVTHDIREALFLADRVLLLSRRPGRLLETLAVRAARPRPHDFMASEEYVSLYKRLLERLPA